MRKRSQRSFLPTCQLGLTYDAIRVCGTAALRAAGYRVIRGNNEHYRTIEALEFSIDPERKIIPMLDKRITRERQLKGCSDSRVPRHIY